MHATTRARLIQNGLILLCCSVVLTGCLSTKSYVDPRLPLVGKGDIPRPAEPAPVQVLVEFQTKGTPNASATSAVKPRAIAVASESGLFSGVSATATDGAAGGLLTVMINNTPVGSPGAKGFGTGLTLGAVGSLVTDNYVCKATYTRDQKSTEVELEHQLHTTVGNKSGPPGLTAVTMQQGAEQVIDQLIWNALSQLSAKKAFD
jgi:hypothetical protein